MILLANDNQNPSGTENLLDAGQLVYSVRFGGNRDVGRSLNYCCIKPLTAHDEPESILTPRIRICRTFIAPHARLLREVVGPTMGGDRIVWLVVTSKFIKIERRSQFGGHELDHHVKYLVRCSFQSTIDTSPPSTS